MPDTPEFLATSQKVMALLHEQLNRLGAIPEGSSMTLVEIVRHVISTHSKMSGETPEATSS